MKQSSQTQSSLSKNEVVRKGYNQMASAYAADRDLLRSEPYLNKLIQLLPTHAQILDLGCGNGLPVDGLLLKKNYLVTGLDISETQISLARKNCPTGEFVVADISKLKPKQYQVDAIVSFYALFHLPRTAHQQLLNTFASFLTKGGLLLITMGDKDYEGFHDLYGVKMWSSHFGLEKNTAMVEKAGFEILINTLDRSGRESHQIILAKKK